MKTQISPENYDDARLYRRLLLIAGSVYLLWWFAVEMILPGTFNPFISRILVCSYILGIWLLSFAIHGIQRWLRILFISSVWLITAHYWYLLYENQADINWIIGAFITVMAISLGLLSSGSLLAYSIFVMALGLTVFALVPSQRHSIFLPGLLTILVQANIGFRTRLGLIKTLRDSNERFQLLFDSTFEGVFVHKQGVALDVNESLARMLGYQKSELIGRHLVDFVEESYRPTILEKMKIPAVSPYEIKGIRKNGSLIDLEMRAKEFLYREEVARLVTVLDISDRENVRVRDDFISLASHELKTPISSLKLQTQLIERNLDKDPTYAGSPEKIRKFVELFHRQVDRLTELVDAMLDVSRISANRLVLDKRSMDLTKAVHEVVAGLLMSVTAKLPDNLPITADPSRLKQVIENLLTNAAKYGQGKEIEIRAEKKGDRAVLEVVDQGMGIAPEDQEKIFQRFERAVGPRNISGLGLGLYISRQIIEAHGGQLTVESQISKGAKFRVDLPLS